MLLANFKVGKKFFTGVVEGDYIRKIEGSPYDPEFILTEEKYNLGQIRLLAPCQPTKIVAVGLNYRDHAEELKMDLPEEPLIFIKPSTSVIGHLDEILYPEDIGRLDYEAELGVVIKKCCKNVPADKAKDYILGYTCVNDVTARDLQKKDKQWTRSKSFDTFCPLGPFIVTDLDIGDLYIKLFLNNQLKQSSNTNNLIFSPDYLVSFISGICTLLPGDVIATGTPRGVGPMRSGDVVEVNIQSIGVLKNKVVGISR